MVLLVLSYIKIFWKTIIKPIIEIFYIFIKINKDLY